MIPHTAKPNAADRLLQGVTTVGERGQIVIPLSIRKALRLKPGDTMVVLMRGKKVVIFPAKELESVYRGFLDEMEVVRNLRPKNKKPSARRA